MEPIVMVGVNEYAEGMPVKLVGVSAKDECLPLSCDGKLVLQALNEGGCNHTLIDLNQLLSWVSINKPDMYNKYTPKTMDFNGKKLKHLDILQVYDLSDGVASTGYPFLMLVTFDGGGFTFSDGAHTMGGDKAINKSKGVVVGSALTNVILCDEYVIDKESILEYAKQFTNK